LQSGTQGKQKLGRRIHHQEEGKMEVEIDDQAKIKSVKKF